MARFTRKKRILVDRLADELEKQIPPGADVVCPLTLGGHVDHRLTRAAVEKTGRKIWYYADYPYVLSRTAELDALRQSGWQSTTFPVSDAGLEAWIASVAAYTSQISTFWPDAIAMRAGLQDLWQSSGSGVQLWKKLET